MVKKVIGYARVSRFTEEIENQIKAIEVSAKQRNFELITIYKDIGISGSVGYEKREHFQELIERLKENKDYGVIVYAMDRLGRNTLDTMNCVEYLNEVLKVDIYYIRQPDYQLSADLMSNPIQKVILSNVLQLMAELERTFTIERTKEALNQRKKQLKENGYFISKAGNTITHLGKFSKELDWKKIKEYRNKKISWTAIAKLEDITYMGLLKKRKEKYKETKEEWIMFGDKK